MGNACTQTRNQNEDEDLVIEVKHVPPQTQNQQSYSVQLHLPTMMELKIGKNLGDDDHAQVDITTDRKNLSESRDQSGTVSDQQFLPKKYYEETMTINKSHKFVISGMDEDIVNNLEDLGEIQKSILDKQHQEDECQDYDLLYQVDYDNIKLQAPSIMKQVDFNKQTSIKQRRRLSKQTQ